MRIAIGERRRPTPNNRPGYLRVDSVHQGDFDGIKGIYLINAVDQVTQFEVVCAVEKISERFLLPVLEALINAFPFHITGFHSDNGSEYINHRVAALLNKLNVTEFTKSRARQTNDNALVESKNGSVVRKHLGYGHVPGRFALAVNDFTFNVLAPYLNFHRPCFFPETFIDDKGRQRKRYPYAALMTPFEKLCSIPTSADFLKPGVTLESLNALALNTSDNDAARHFNQARESFFKQSIFPGTAPPKDPLQETLQTHLWIGMDWQDPHGLNLRNCAGRLPDWAWPGSVDTSYSGSVAIEMCRKQPTYTPEPAMGSSSL